jgi:hypothetical protein
VASDLFGQPRVVECGEAECCQTGHGDHPRKGVYQAPLGDRVLETANGTYPLSH